MRSRWRDLRRILDALSLACLCAASVNAQSPATQPSVVRVGTTVQDVDRSVEFFTKVLDFEKVSDAETDGEQVEKLTGVFGARCRVVRVRLGSEELELTQFLAASTPGRRVPSDSRSNDRWFQHVAIVTSDIDAAYRRLRHFGVRHASTAPQRLPAWNENAGGIAAFYFHDPDEHVLEIIQFPTGKGDPRWQTSRGLLLGIDHTAIVIAETKSSLAFYRDQLGLRVAGGSENYGGEQAHLNNVPGAHLRITALRGATGPGVELLEYLAPRDGRAFPGEPKPNDLFHWQTTIAGGIFATAHLVRDPDGHALLLADKRN